MYRFEIPTPMKKLERAAEAVRRAEERYKEIKEGLADHDPEITERSLIHCKSCGKGTQAKNIRFARYYWYESPHGCMGGDHWHSNGFVIYCPKCGEWEHVHPATNSLPNYSQQEVEYRIIEKLLKFGTQYGDVRYSNCETKFTESIEWEYN
jgi:hypothetical protein